jgi:hypothetical protein
MALLAFEDSSKCPISDLLDNANRQKTASELNAAILSMQAQQEDPKLPQLLKMLKWVQVQLDDKVKYPRVSNYITGELEEL